MYIFPSRLFMASFNDAWLEKDDATGEAFKNWLLPSPGNSAQAVCAICHWKHFDISIGVEAIVRHSNSKQHKRVSKTKPCVLKVKHSSYTAGVPLASILKTHAHLIQRLGSFSPIVAKSSAPNLFRRLYKYTWFS